MTERAVRLDFELLELLADEPVLLAIADAVSATQPRHRSRRWARVAVVSAAAVVAVSAAITFTRQAADGSLLPQALAAVGRGPVVRAQLEATVPGATVIVLATGQARRPVVSLSYIYDPARARLRAVVRRDGVVVGDTLRGTGPAGAPSAAFPALDGFVTGYREDLADGSAQRSGAGVVGGRSVVWLTMHGGDRVAVDTARFVPVAVEESDGARGDLRWRVVSITSTGRRPGDFSVSRREPVPFRGDVRASEPLSSAQAAASLRWPAAWLGEGWRGLRLVSLDRQSLTRGYAPAADGPRTGVGLRLRYEGARGRFLEVLESRRPEPAYGFAGAGRTLQGNPIPAVGELELGGHGSSTSAQFHRKGAFVTIWGSSGELCVEAARALRPFAAVRR